MRSGPKTAIAAPVRALRAAGLILALMLTAGCAAKKSGESEVSKATAEDYDARAPRSIAVLPFDNMSTDLDATPLIRPIVRKRLVYKGYDCPGLKKIDDSLTEAGVMVSHDVYAFTPEELGEMLGVDAVMFGTVTDFTTKYAVVYASIAVQLRLELVDCETGDVLWRNEQRASENTALENILTLLLYHDQIEKGLAVVAAANAIWAALEQFRPYAERAAAKTLSSLPPGHKGASAYPWDPDEYDPGQGKAILYFGAIQAVPP